MLELLTLDVDLYLQVNGYRVDVIHDARYVVDVILSLLQDGIHALYLGHLLELLVLHPLYLLLLEYTLFLGELELVVHQKVVLLDTGSSFVSVGDLRALERLPNQTTGQVSVLNLLCLDLLCHILKSVKVLLLSILKRLQLLLLRTRLLAAFLTSHLFEDLNHLAVGLQ